LYSPTKAIKELAEKPSYKGVILILILFVALSISANYVVYTKYSFQKVKPDLFEEGSDIWTENATFWEPSEYCMENNASVYGEYSIACTVTNKSELYMQIKFSESINCSASEFNQTSFSIKLVNTNVSPNASLILLLSETGNFTRNFEDKIGNWSSWSNITLPLGEKSEGWNVNGDARWDKISGLKILLRFPTSVNATLLLDALFFRGQYEPAIKYFTIIASQFTIFYFISFMLLWIIFGGLLYILSKYAGSELTWKHNLIVSGYSLAPLLVQGICWIILFLFLPQMNIAIGTVTSASTDGTIIFDAATYSQFIFLAWGIIISTFAVRELNNFTANKSAAISLASYLTAFFLVRMLGF